MGLNERPFKIVFSFMDGDGEYDKYDKIRALLARR